MNRLALALARGKFAIEIQTALALVPSVHAFLAGEDVDFSFEENESRISAGVITANWTRALDEFIDGDLQVEPGSVGVIKVEGPIMKDDFCGWSGSITMANQLKWMDANENINGILIEVDSPGGHVDGTATLADAIRNATTPTIALVNDGMACSAGYWIASAADTVYATHAHSEVGSIGVYATLSDFTKYYEDKGIVLEDLYATQSTEKNKGYRDWKAGNAEEFVNRLSATADVFINTVKTHRAGKLNLEAGDPFKGAVYSATKAVEIGLIDGIKPYDQVMNELLNTKQTLKFS